MLSIIKLKTLLQELKISYNEDMIMYTEITNENEQAKDFSLANYIYILGGQSML